MLVWCAPAEVFDLVNTVKKKWHLPRLEEAEIAISFNDSKPFKNGRFNWGKTAKFSSLAKLWHSKKYDFHISLCADAWLTVLKASQREALIDLHLTRCVVEYMPETIEENGKKHPVKDEWGRVQFTNEIKKDDDGIPKWKIDPLDLNVFQENVIRYGVWCQDLLDFKSAIVNNEGKDDGNQCKSSFSSDEVSKQ